MTEKSEIIQTYQKKEVVSTFDKERDLFAYQREKHKIEANLLIDSLKKLKQKEIKVLDVACGTGRMLPVIFSQDKEIDYTGLDTSDEMTSILLKKAKNLGVEKKMKLKIGDATKIPFKDESFDLVFSYHLLWHLPKEEQEKIIKEMIRVTKREGVVIFDILNENFIWEKIKKILGLKDTEGIHKLKLSEIRRIIGKQEYALERVNDAPIKNNFLYSLFSIINKTRKILPTNLFHMVYFQIKKG